jgi:glycine cleavage system H protein
VVAINERLASEPELVNQDCYGDGWMLKVKLTNLSELDHSLTADAYKSFVVE